MIRSFAAASLAAAALLMPVTAAVVATAPVAVAAPAAPSAGELNGVVQSAFNGNSGALESGDASSIAVVRERVNAIPGYHWSVVGPVSVDGDVASATINSSLGDYTFPIPVTFKYIGGAWKLSQESEQTLIGYATMSW
ncbi:hypothetical protein ACWEVD_31600 [Nocardia thailandica]|uniref:Low molecular weight antigen MTB12-like C-terminal domain-containing protein n=1 Tax=Nocardia thailandica TaxID=257275 RepID=A0ABW6PTY6_9NOCA|nr:hypothetical protein [Nocardia thailandica]